MTEINQARTSENVNVEIPDTIPQDPIVYSECVSLNNSDILTKNDLENVNISENKIIQSNENIDDIKNSNSNINRIHTPIETSKENQNNNNEGTEENGATSTQFIINLMKGIAGTGMLAVPYSISKMGIILGIILYILVALSYFYGASTLLKFKGLLNNPSEEVKKLVSNSDYVRIVYSVLGTPGYYLIMFAILITLWGACIGTMVVMTDFASSLPWELFGVTASNTTIRVISCAILTILILFMELFKDTKPLVYISSLGLIAIAISFIALFIRGGIDFGITFDIHNLYPISWNDTLSQLGVIVYSLGFILFLFPLYKPLKPSHKKHAKKSIFISIFLMTLIYLCTSIPLFLIFQQDPKGIQSNIVLNLKSGSIESIIINIGMIICCLGSYPLTLLGVLEITEAKFKEMKTWSIFVADFKHIFYRILQVIIISAISLLIPFFGSVLGFIGSFTSILAAQLLPALMNIVYYHKNKNTQSVYGAVFHYIFFIVFIVIMCVCTYISGKSLIEEMKTLFH